MSSSIRRSLMSTLIFIICATLIVPSEFAHGDANPKVLRRLGSEVSTLDPQGSGQVIEIGPENALFRGLLRYDEQGNPAPSIAQEVPTLGNGGISADGKTYTYHLRRWAWSDGKGNVTAQDFVYSFERLVDPSLATPYGTFLNGIVVNATEISEKKLPPSTLGVRALDADTVQFSLVKPISYFNEITALWIGYAVRKDNVERRNLPSTSAWTDPQFGAVVGSGPFRIVSWDHHKQMVLERNPYYSGTPARLDRIELMIVDDPATAFAGFQADSLDISSFPITEYSVIQNDSALSQQLVRYPTACTNYLAMDNTRPPFNNKLVREAFTHGINRDAHSRVLDKGLSTKQLSWLPPSIPGYDPKLGQEYDFNPDKARQALSNAGYPNGQGFPDVNFNYSNNANSQRIADWYTEQIKQVLNVDVKQNPMDRAALSAAIYSLNTKLAGLYEYAWCADYLHPSDWLQIVFGTGQGNNVVGYSNPQFDKLSMDADSEVEPAKALDKYRQAHEFLVSDFPVVFLNVSDAFVLVKPWVKGLKPFSLDSGYVGAYFWEVIDIQQ